MPGRAVHLRQLVRDLVEVVLDELVSQLARARLAKRAGQDAGRLAQLELVGQDDRRRLRHHLGVHEPAHRTEQALALDAIAGLLRVGVQPIEQLIGWRIVRALSRLSADITPPLAAARAPGTSQSGFHCSMILFCIQVASDSLSQESKCTNRDHLARSISAAPVRWRVPPRDRSRRSESFTDHRRTHATHPPHCGVSDHWRGR